MDIISYILSRKYCDNSLIGLGAIKGANCTVKDIVHQDGVNTVTFEWEGTDGTTKTRDMVVYDGTPIYVWESGNTYHYGDLAIYESQFYRCIVENNDVTFDSTKWNEIGSPDGNYNIVQSVNLLPTRFTAADRKLYYVIDENCFYLWNGTAWVKTISNKIADLDDVNLDDLTEGNVLVWDSVNEKWVNDDKFDTKLNDIWKVQGELGAKNLIPYPYPREFSSGTTSGVTFTINDDGSVTLNGTATATIYKLLHTRNFGDKSFSSKYNNPNAPYLATLLNGTNDVYCNYNPKDHYTTLVVEKGAIIDNLTVYPMLRYKSDTDDTWQPYAPTNYQLNQKVDMTAGVYLPNATNTGTKKVVASIGQTSVTFYANSFMTRYNVTASDLDLDVSAETSSGDIIAYNNVSVTGGIVTVTFDALAEQTTFICKCSVIQ